MPESASAVSQIAEEEHKGERQMKERESKRECEREDRYRKRRNLRECSAVQSV